MIANDDIKSTNSDPLMPRFLFLFVFMIVDDNDDESLY